MSITLLLSEIWSFENLANLKFGLKSPPPKFTFLGVLTPKHYFLLSRPQNGTSLREIASYEL